LAVALAEDPAFLWNLVVLGPIFAVAGAGSAAGSLALARRAEDRELLEASEDVAEVGLSKVRRASCSEAGADLSTWIQSAALENVARPVVCGWPGQSS